MSAKKSRAAILSVLWLLSALLGSGCGSKGGEVGDTVPTPPRALVDQSFHPPTNVVRPEDRENEALRRTWVETRV